MDNGNYAPIYQQLSGNYIGPTYLPQTQQIQQLDYSFPNDYPNAYVQFHQNNEPPLTVLPSIGIGSSVLVHGERVILASKNGMDSGQQQEPTIVQNVHGRNQADRIPNTATWIKQEDAPLNNTESDCQASKPEILTEQAENSTIPSFSQAFTEAVFNKGIKEQFVKKPISKRVRRKGDKPPKPRTRNPDTWKRNKIYQARLRGEQYESKSVAGLCEVTGKTIFTKQEREARRMKPPCKPHRNSIFQCQRFTQEIRQAIFDHFWQNLNWPQRKSLVAEHVKVEPVKTTCARGELKQKRFVNIKYYLDIEGEHQMVCKDLFHGTFGINHHSTHYWLISLNKIEMDKTERDNKSVCLAKLVGDANKPIQRPLKKRERLRLEAMAKKENPNQTVDFGTNDDESNVIEQKSEEKTSPLPSSQLNMRRFSKQQDEIGPPCNCRSSAIFTKDCSDFTDEIRTKIFNNFWNFMDFDSRKSFFLEHVNVVEPYDKKKGLLDYYLPIDGIKYPICQRLYLSTLGIGRYTCRFWLQAVGIFPEDTEKPAANVPGKGTESASITQNTVKSEDPRKRNPMGPRCRCKYQNIDKRKCQKFTEFIRKRIYNKFWCELNIAARKEFLRNHVAAEPVRSELIQPGRRQWTALYYLPIKSERLNVCHTLFHTTLGFSPSSLRKRLQNAGILPSTERTIDFVAIGHSNSNQLLTEDEQPIDSMDFYYEHPDMNAPGSEIDERIEEDVDYHSQLKVENISDSESEFELEPKRKKTICDYLSELINQISRPVLKLKELQLDDFSNLTNYSDLQEQFAYYKTRESESDHDSDNADAAFVDVKDIKTENEYED